jgi:hypothetical protein
MPCAYGFIRQVTSSSAVASLHVVCDILVYSEFDSFPVNTEKVLMELEGLGTAILGGGTDADAVATMHGLSRCARARGLGCIPRRLFFPSEIYGVTLCCRALQRMLSVAADVHTPAGLLLPSPPSLQLPERISLVQRFVSLMKFAC